MPIFLSYESSESPKEYFIKHVSIFFPMNIHSFVLCVCAGMSCVAQNSVDGRWQRARVVDLPGDHRVIVKFVDFGSTETLGYHQIYKIMDDFLVLPNQVC